MAGGKKAPSAYQLFSKHVWANRDSFRDQCGGNPPGIKDIGRMWNEMDDEARKPFIVEKTLTDTAPSSEPRLKKACSDTMSSPVDHRKGTRKRTRSEGNTVESTQTQSPSAATQAAPQPAKRRQRLSAKALEARLASDEEHSVDENESDADYSSASDSSEPVKSSRSARMAGKATRRSSNGSSAKKQKAKPRKMMSKTKSEAQVNAAMRKEVHAVQMDAQRLKNEQMAKARMRFLLKQGDVFSHFVTKSGTNLSAILKEQFNENEDEKRASKTVRTSGKKQTKGSRGKHSQSQQDDDDNTEDLTEDGLDLHIFESSPAFIKGGEMRDYQIEGLNWMAELQSNGMSGILADEMGLGKTLQSISMLGYMQHIKSVSGPHLVIGPKSTVSNWLNEVRKWCPSLRPVVLQGAKDQRAEFLKEHIVPGRSSKERTFDVLITSYEMSIIEKGILGKIPWVYLVLDEAHRVKNEHSKLAQTLRAFSVQHRLLLTGTPLQNNLHELWALLNFLLPEIFSSSEVFDDWFNLANVDDREAKETMVRQLHRILKPFMLRRLKKDVAKTLPPKKETMLYVGMSEMQREVYRRILERDMDAVVTNKVNKNRLQNIVMQLRKVTNHPYLINGVEDRSLDPLGEHMVFNSAKLVLLDKLLPKLKKGGNRVLIFSQMTRLLDILEDFLGTRGYLYCRIDGSTGYDEREDMIDRFNREGSEYFVFLLSTRAGGLGINLATADTVILFDSDWNPQMDLQAQDRAHRIGQKKPVNVYRLVTEDSVEEKIVERAETKLRLDAVVIQQGRLVDQAKSKINKDDMLAMIRFGAANIFRSGGSTVTDEDIDAILQRGEEKTKALCTKLEKYESGDLLDFKLEYSGSIQEFGGIDYSAVGRGGAKRMMHGGVELATTIANAKGKRKRSERGYKEQDYYRNISAQKLGLKNPNRRIRIPEGLKLKPFKKWHFYDEERLEYLYGEAIKAHREWYLEESEKPEGDGEKKNNEEGGVGSSNSPDSLSIEQFFTAEQNEERLALLADGMPDWSSSEYQAFIQGCAKYGRHNLEEITMHIPTKTREQVERYASRFFEFGSRTVRNWDKLQVQFAKTEKKILAITENLAKIQKMMQLYQEPVFQFRFNRSQLNSLRGKEFTLQEDILILSLLCELGYGRWTELHRRVQNDELLPCSYYLKSRTREDLQRRCNTLVRLVVKDIVAQTKCAQGMKWKSVPQRTDLEPVRKQATPQTDTKPVEAQDGTLETVKIEDRVETELGTSDQRGDQKSNQSQEGVNAKEIDLMKLLEDASSREAKRIIGVREKQVFLQQKIAKLKERGARKQEERAEKLAAKYQKYLVRHEKKFSNERQKLALRLAEYVDPDDPESAIVAAVKQASEEAAQDSQEESRDRAGSKDSSSSGRNRSNSKSSSVGRTKKSVGDAKGKKTKRQSPTKDGSKSSPSLIPLRKRVSQENGQLNESSSSSSSSSESDDQGESSEVDMKSPKKESRTRDGSRLHVLPVVYYPIFAQTVRDGGRLGKAKLKERIMAKLPTGLISMRQLGKELDEIGEKSKLEGEAHYMWHIKSSGLKKWNKRYEEWHHKAYAGTFGEPFFVEKGSSILSIGSGVALTKISSPGSSPNSSQFVANSLAGVSFDVAIDPDAPSLTSNLNHRIGRG